MSGPSSKSPHDKSSGPDNPPSRPWNSAEKPRPARRWRLPVAIFLVLLAVFVFLPTIVGGTGLRNSVLAKVFPNWPGTIQCDRAHLWWFSPVKFENVSVKSAEGEEVVSLPTFETERKLLEFLLGSNELGQLRLLHPKIQIVVDEGGVNLTDLVRRDPEAEGKARRTLSLVIVDGEITFRGSALPVPETTIGSLDIEASLSHDTQGQRIWTIHPGRILDKVPVTREMVDSGLRYVAPILSNAAWVEGKLSLDIAECQILVATPENSKVSGQLSIHTIEAGAKNPLITDLADFAGALLKRDVPTKIRLADQSVVDFKLEDRRVYHENLAFGLPEVAPDLVVRTKGWVSFDQTLDMMADVPLPVGRFSDNPLLRSLGSPNISVTIVGPINKPRIRLAESTTAAGKNALDSLLGRLRESTVGESGPKLADVFELLQEIRPKETAESKDGKTPEKKTADEKTPEEKVAEGVLTIGEQLLLEAQKRMEARRELRKNEGKKEIPSEEAKKKDEEKSEKRKQILKGLFKGIRKAVEESKEETPPKN